MISVIISVYNGDKYLEDAIKSILNQTFEDFELIIVNDASTDNTQNIIDKYVDLDKRVSSIINEINQGISISRNIALVKSQGKYIATMDADDVSMPDRLEIQYNFMEKNPDIVLCGGYIQMCDKELNVLSEKSYPIDDISIRKRIFRISPFAHPSTFYRAEIAKKIGGYSYVFKAALDYDFYFRMANFGKLQNIDKVLIKYRIHDESISQAKAQLQQELTLYIRLKAIFEYGFKWTFSDKIYWVLQYIGIKVFPTTWIFKIYHFIRKLQWK
jgi:glycosyltransferase involved in cell wall biosynthesis